jgi:WhiB family redox-sensing transcriptional regulator
MAQEDAMTRDPAWMADARCRGMDPDVFHPVHPHGLKGDPTRAVERARALDANILAVCAQCPVIDECRDYALHNGEDIGVWGGLTEMERRRILNRQRRGGKTHGTYTMYRNGCDCEPCRTAGLAYVRKHRWSQGDPRPA